MIDSIKKTALLFMMLIPSMSTFAQQNQPVEMADELYQSGKIYVVVTIIAIIFVGIIAYLILLDKKIRTLEKAINKNPM